MTRSPSCRADEIARKDPSFRRELTDLATVVAGEDVVRRTLERLRREYVSGLLPAPSDDLEQINRLDEVDVTTRLKKRHGACYALESDGDRVRLHFPGAVVELPGYVAPAVDFILRTDAFAVGDLPGLPSDSQRLILIRHLVGCGFVQTSGRAIGDD